MLKSSFRNPMPASIRFQQGPHFQPCIFKSPMLFEIINSMFQDPEYPRYGKGALTPPNNFSSRWGDINVIELTFCIKPFQNYSTHFGANLCRSTNVCNLITLKLPYRAFSIIAVKLTKVKTILRQLFPKINSIKREKRTLRSV